MKKKSIDTIGNRTRDLPACSSVPQPTALPCAPIHIYIYIYIYIYIRRNASLITGETAWYYSVLRGKIVYPIILMNKNRTLKIKHSRRTSLLTFPKSYEL